MDFLQLEVDRRLREVERRSVSIPSTIFVGDDKFTPFTPAGVALLGPTDEVIDYPPGGTGKAVAKLIVPETWGGGGTLYCDMLWTTDVAHASNTIDILTGMSERKIGDDLTSAVDVGGTQSLSTNITANQMQLTRLDVELPIAGDGQYVSMVIQRNGTTDTATGELYLAGVYLTFRRLQQ